VLWCGRSALEGAVALVLLPAGVFAALQTRQGHSIDGRHGAWWVLYLGGLLGIAELTGAGRLLPLGTGAQLLLVAAFALAVFPLAVHSRLPRVAAQARVSLGDTPEPA
jgi:hypothetical protein